MLYNTFKMIECIIYLLYASVCCCVKNTDDEYKFMTDDKVRHKCTTQS
jgi:hypothetical protein